MKSSNSISYWRSALLMAGGLVAGSFIGALIAAIIFRSGITGWVLGFIPSGQAFLRLLGGIILIYLVIALSAGIGGFSAGYAAWRIDQSPSRRRYALGGAWAFAAAEAILLIPLLLYFAFAALYQNGVMGEQVRYGILLGIFGLFYGLLVGIILALLTVKIRYSWIVIVASVLGFGLAMGIIGFLLRYVGEAEIGTLQTATLALRLAIAGLILHGVGGAALGLAFARIARKRAILGDERMRSGWVQTGLVLATSALALLVLMAFTNQVASFLTRQTGSTTTELPLDVTGIHWGNPVPVASGVLRVDDAPPGLATADDGSIAIAWARDSGGDADVYLQIHASGISESGASGFNVSNSPEAQSKYPVLAFDASGGVNVVWVEEDGSGIGIAHSRCAGSSCSPAFILSDLAGLTCATGIAADAPPTMSVNDGDEVMAVWASDDGELLYATWPAQNGPVNASGGCLSPDQVGGTLADPQVSATADGFALAFSEDGAIKSVSYSGDNWHVPGQQAGMGSHPSILTSGDGAIYLAWCGDDGIVQFSRDGGTVESIAGPGCSGRPEISEDGEGQPHAVWYSEQVIDLFGQTRSSKLLYESMRQAESWTEPAIITTTTAKTQPSVTSQANGNLHMAWVDGAETTGELFYSLQEPYECGAAQLNALDKVVLNIMENGGFHPQGYQAPYCRNDFLGFVYMPNPEPEFSESQPTVNGGFDQVSEQILNAKYEVLFSTMMWDPAFESYVNPGFVLAEAVAKLYEAVKTNPDAYPRGMNVRILLGNYPNTAKLQWGDQIWDVLSDLRRANVPTMIDEEIGWKLEVANYAGVYPHSHTKFLVVDGKGAAAGGFNYGYLHFPHNHPSGKGDDLSDLAMKFVGPVSQQAMSTFDDQWQNANQIHCTDLYPEDGSDWQSTCREFKATVSHVPEVTKYFLASGNDSVFSLYRTASFKEADSAVGTAIASATESIDSLNVNFSLDFICILSVLDSNLCTFEDNALPWMHDMVQAVENGAHVRIMAENSNMNGLENRIGMHLLMKELERRGLSDQVEIRFFGGRVHTKSMLLDGSLLIVGSQNLHYSSWGSGGLNEYALATDAPDAIEEYQNMYEYEWERATPYDETLWTTSPS
ncbi:MAG: hypothetical protein J5I90_13730 [Caldilineales bacterium]|nr:hypothetical protein [Caldilineales bacterium]